MTWVLDFTIHINKFRHQMIEVYENVSDLIDTLLFERIDYTDSAHKTTFVGTNIRFQTTYNKRTNLVQQWNSFWQLLLFLRFSCKLVPLGTSFLCVPISSNSTNTTTTTPIPTSTFSIAAAATPTNGNNNNGTFVQAYIQKANAKLNQVEQAVGAPPVYRFVNSVVYDNLTSSQLDAIHSISGINIETDKPATIQSTVSQINPAAWGIDRIDQRNLPLDNKYSYPSQAGQGVNVYVLDTGILANHVEYNGRDTFLANFAGDGINTDCNGHGTHVSGTIGGTTVGVAKKVTLFGVKVLDCNGNGFISNIMAGFNLVISQRTMRQPTKRPSSTCHSEVDAFKHSMIS